MIDYIKGNPIEIGEETQFFIDRRSIEDVWKMRKVVSPPKRSLCNPIVKADRPWEKDLSQPTVMHVKEKGRYRMYYRSHGKEFTTDPRHLGQPLFKYICMAESEDGINWEKGEIDDSGRNIVFPRREMEYLASYNMPVRLPPEADTRERFTFFCQNRKVFPTVMGMVYSDDGIDWEEEKMGTDIPYHLDCSNDILWNEKEGLYFLYTRPSFNATGGKNLPDGIYHTRRRVALMTSRDMRSWSEPRTIIFGEDPDTPDHNWFTPFRRHGMFFGLANMLESEEVYEQNIHLYWSEDGIRWERLPLDQPFIARAGGQTWDSNYVITSSAPLVIGNEMLFYYQGSDSGEQNYECKQNAIGVATSTVDRMIALRPDGERTGYVMTREFVCRGDELRINALCHDKLPHRIAELKVEVMDRPSLQAPVNRNPPPAEGFSFDDCDTRLCTSHDHPVTWKGKGLSAFKGKRIWLRFRVKHGSLYSWRIASSKKVD